MWSFRRDIHKLSNIINRFIPCDGNLDFTGQEGIFIVDFEVGTDLGQVILNYQAFGVPDRFQLIYDGNIVADSLYVGGNLTGNPPENTGAGGAMVGTTYNNIPEYEWNGVAFVPNGNTQTFTVQQSDIAPFGSTAATGSISFNKNTASPTSVRLIVYAPLGGTAWGVDLECPTSAACTITTGTDFIASIPQQQLFWIDGVTAPTNVTIEFLLSDVFDDDLITPMEIGIDGAIMTKDVPLVVTPTIVQNGGSVYDYEAFITPKNNYDDSSSDSFKVTMTVTSVDSNGCIDGTNTQEFQFGSPPQLTEILLWYDPSTSCPSSNPVTYYIEGTINDWLTTTRLYSDQGGTPAPSGHYKPATAGTTGEETSREWVGIAFGGDTVCP